MLTTQDLTATFARSLTNIQTALKEVSESECVYQPPFNSNCINWVLGHILNNRNSILRFLGATPILTEEQRQRYAYGSPPVCAAGPDVIPLGEMLRLLEESQLRIAAALEVITPAGLLKETEHARRKMTVEQALLFTLGHDCLHAGELNILKELVASCRPAAAAPAK